MDLTLFLCSQGDGDVISLERELEAARRYGVTIREVEETALEAGLLPLRYTRNRESISIAQQRELLGSGVAIVGCGGLGGYVAEELARLGVGTLILFDPDVFEEHNLNRQLHSSVATLGRPKVLVTAERIGTINPVVTAVPVEEAFVAERTEGLLSGTRVVVDCLDSIPTRLELAVSCEKLGIPLVHGSIGGWYGQVAVQFPGENTLQRLYGHVKEGSGIEKRLGNPAFTPAVIAGLQAAEAIKILLGQGTPLRGRMLFIDLLNMGMEEVTC